MANTRSAAKRARQTETRTAHNRAIKSRIKNSRKAVLDAIAAGDLTLAQTKLGLLSAAADKAANRNVIHKNAAGRLKQKLAHAIAKAQTA